MKRVEGGKFKTCGEHGKWVERESEKKKAEQKEKAGFYKMLVSQTATAMSLR